MSLNATDTLRKFGVCGQEQRSCEEPNCITGNWALPTCRQCERAPHKSSVARESTNVRDVKISDDDVFSVPRAFPLRTNTITENSHTTQTTIFTFLHLQLSHSAIVMLFNSRLCQIALSISGPSLCFVLGEQTFVDSVAASLSLCVMGRQYWRGKSLCVQTTPTYCAPFYTHMTPVGHVSISIKIGAGGNGSSQK